MRISLHNIGPIRDGAINLGSLTILVGPNGSGKSLFSTIAYAATRSANIAFRRANMELMDVPLRSRTSRSSEELAEIICERWEAEFRTRFEHDVRRCCSQDLSKLAREFRKGNGAAPRVVVSSGPEDSPHWRIVFRLKKDKFVVERSDARYIAPNLGLHDLDGEDLRKSRRRLTTELLTGVPRRATYFPASRSGFMQAYNALSSLVWGALGGGYFEQATVGSIPGTVSDFLQFLAQMRPDRQPHFPMETVVEVEAALLRGRVSLMESNGRLNVAYHPSQLQQTWPIEEAPSSTAELAPLSLYLRHHARPYDAIFIDEPEAHLHPANQVVLASFLTKIAASIRSVCIATHSDFLASELSNVAMEKQLSFLDTQPETNEQIEAYEFTRLGDREGVEVSRLNYDLKQGFEINQFSAVADDTYNRAIALYNKLNR